VLVTNQALVHVRGWVNGRARQTNLTNPIDVAGVGSVDVDPKECHVTVSGHVEAPEAVSRLRRRAGKKAEPWPFVPHPYASGVYGHKAPPGYVRNVLDDPEAAPLVREPKRLRRRVMISASRFIQLVMHLFFFLLPLFPLMTVQFCGILICVHRFCNVNAPVQMKYLPKY
jgi:hypothetical protein